MDPRTDCKVGVFLIITLYSGNREGACTLSIDQIARFLSSKAVLAAFARLEEDQLIMIERRPGSTSLATPWVHRAFGLSRPPDLDHGRAGAEYSSWQTGTPAAASTGP